MSSSSGSELNGQSRCPGQPDRNEMCQDAGVSEKLPYQEMLEEAGKQARVLERDDVYGSGPPVDAVHGELLEFIAQVAGRAVLDIGCGLGPYVAELNKRGFACVGIEMEPELAKAAAGLERPVLLMDGRALGFADASFDTCVLIEVIEHVRNFDLLLTEAARVARRNIVISVPNIGSIPTLSRHNVVPWHMLEATHVNFFTPEILRRAVERTLLGQGRVRVEEYAPFFPWAEDAQLYYQIRAVVELAEPSDDTGKYPQG